MAERRMLARSIMESDAFLDMPLSTQALYCHLNVRADDDGFLNNQKKIQREVRCSDDDYKLLIAKKFIIPFETGVVVIKHWKIHNYIRNDRYKETHYKEEKASLGYDENKAYTQNEVHLGIPSDIPMVDAGKVRLDKVKEVVQKAKLFTPDIADRLWNEYPLKKGKHDSYRHIEKLINKGVTEEELMKCLLSYKAQIKDPQYTLMGSTFFNSRWEDYKETNTKVGIVAEW